MQAEVLVTSTTELGTTESGRAVPALPIAGVPAAIALPPCHLQVVVIGDHFEQLGRAVRQPPEYPVKHVPALAVAVTSDPGPQQSPGLIAPLIEVLDGQALHHHQSQNRLPAVSQCPCMFGIELQI
jgi:hypothetical protein